jgi:hypothetical protein
MATPATGRREFALSTVTYLALVEMVKRRLIGRLVAKHR